MMSRPPNVRVTVAAYGGPASAHSTRQQQLAADANGEDAKRKLEAMQKEIENLREQLRDAERKAEPPAKEKDREGAPDPGNWGVLRGRVRFKGPQPIPADIKPLQVDP